MFFRKKPEVASAARAQTVAADVARSTPSGGRDASRDGDSSLVLDALGGVIATLARFPIELPHRPAEQTAKEMTAWQRHATLGMPVDNESDAAAVGIGDRDWRGLVRAVATARREEQTSIESLVAELRAALWTCVGAVHEAVRIDDSAESKTGSQLAQVKRAVTSSNASTVKDDVLVAVKEIERTIRERRDEQQAQYKNLANSLDSLGRQLEEARKESATDPLTGVGNRKHFDLMSMRAVQIYALSRTPVTLLMIDLNKLKIINDSYGHNAGDAAITSVASALWRVFLRQSDVLTRYGGDEFAVILNNCDLLVAQTLAKRLVEKIRSLPLPDPAMEFALGASVGVAQLLPGEDVVQWVARADRAMYEAKKQAMGSVVLADGGSARAATTQLRTA